MPGHGSGGSTGASVPNGMSAPVSISVRSGNVFSDSAPPAEALLRSVAAQVDRLD